MRSGGWGRAVMIVVAPSAPVQVVLLPMAVRMVALDVQVFG